MRIAKFINRKSLDKMDTLLVPGLEWLVRGDQKRVDDGARMKLGAWTAEANHNAVPTMAGPSNGMA